MTYKPATTKRGLQINWINYFNTSLSIFLKNVCLYCDGLYYNNFAHTMQANVC